MDNDSTLKNAEDLLGDVPEERSLRLADGSSINSLQQLYSALQGMEDEVFRQHVSKEHHAFGNWVKDTHKDYRLANSLFNAESRDACARAVGSRLYELNKVIDSERRDVIALPMEQPSPKQEQHSGPAIDNHASDNDITGENKENKWYDSSKERIEGKADVKMEEHATEKANNKGFRREEAIAKAILERKPVDHLLEPRKKKEGSQMSTSTAAPLRSVAWALPTESLPGSSTSLNVHWWINSAGASGGGSWYSMPYLSAR